MGCGSVEYSKIMMVAMINFSTNILLLLRNAFWPCSFRTRVQIVSAKHQSFNLLLDARAFAMSSLEYRFISLFFSNLMHEADIGFI